MVGSKIKNWDGSITIRTFDHTHNVFQFNINDINKNIDYESWNQESDSAANICMRMLGSNLGNNASVGISEYTKMALEACSSEVRIDKSNINELKSGLVTARSHIQSLRAKEKEAGIAINNTIKYLEGIFNRLSDETRKNNSIAHMNMVVSGYEAYVTTVTRAAISAVRNDMKSRASALVKVIAAVAKTPRELKEAYILETAEDFDMIMNGEFNQGLIDDETRAEMENLLKTTE